MPHDLETMVEHINQLRKWQEQMDKAETGSAADMDVAARLLRHGIEATEALTAITKWLETNQPDVFRRGLWDAILKVGASNTAVLRHNAKLTGSPGFSGESVLDAGLGVAVLPAPTFEKGEQA